jgi:hypothetical protein
MWKGKLRSTYLKLNQWVNLHSLTQNIRDKKYQDIIDDTRKFIGDTNSAPDIVDAEEYFNSPTFGYIPLRGRHNPEYVRVFFSKFEEVQSIKITLKDLEKETIDENSKVILGETNFKMTARSFWFLLPLSAKKYYIECYSDHCERLVNLLQDAKKEIWYEEQ